MLVKCLNIFGSKLHFWKPVQKHKVLLTANSYQLRNAHILAQREQKKKKNTAWVLPSLDVQHPAVNSLHGSCWTTGSKLPKVAEKCRLSIYLWISRGTKNFLKSTNLGWYHKASSSSPSSSSLLKQEGDKLPTRQVVTAVNPARTPNVDEFNSFGHISSLVSNLLLLFLISLMRICCKEWKKGGTREVTFDWRFKQFCFKLSLFYPLHFCHKGCNTCKHKNSLNRSVVTIWTEW